MYSIARNPEVLHATVGEALVLLNPETLAYFEFNEVGVAIWQMLDGGAMSEVAVVGQLLADFEVDEDRCRGAVGAFVDQAEAKGLLVVDRH
ncbi:MAG: PqqD family protein [Actinobacteria bacterium]|nr:MAG: PqqD family protein [Actinomycetota bacterium]